MEKRNNFFKECRNSNGYKVSLAGDAEAPRSVSANQRDIHPTLGGAIFQEPNSGADGTLYHFVQDPFEGTEATHNGTSIPLPICILWWTGQIRSFISYERVPSCSHIEH